MPRPCRRSSGTVCRRTLVTSAGGRSARGSPPGGSTTATCRRSPSWSSGTVRRCTWWSTRAAPSGARAATRSGPRCSRRWWRCSRSTPADVFTKTHTPKAWGRAAVRAARRTRAELEVREGPLRFWVNLSDRLDTGLFLDHRNTRTRVRGESSGRRMLNLFGYTGAFTVAAAVGGAAGTTTVDLSATYLDWAERNLELNGVADGRHASSGPTACSGWRSLPRATSVGTWWCSTPRRTPPARRCAGTSTSSATSAGSSKRTLALLAPGGIVYFSTNYRGFRLEPERLPATLPGADAEEPSARHPPARRPPLLARSPKRTDAPAPAYRGNRPPPQGPEATTATAASPWAPTACRRSPSGPAASSAGRAATRGSTGPICSPSPACPAARRCGWWMAAGWFLGKAFYSSQSKIALRWLSFEDVAIDEAFFAARIAQADGLRRTLFPEETTYRVVHGEADLIPGLVVDRYGDFLSAQFLVQATEARRELLADLLVRHFRPQGADGPHRRRRPHAGGARAAEGGPPWRGAGAGGVRRRAGARLGRPPGRAEDRRLPRPAGEPRPRGAVRPGKGARLLQLPRGLRAAARHPRRARHRGGDLRAGLRRAPRERRAPTASRTSRWSTANAFDFLRDAVDEGRRFDTIVLDPPSFAKNKERGRSGAPRLQGDQPPGAAAARRRGAC